MEALRVLAAETGGRSSAAGDWLRLCTHRSETSCSTTLVSFFHLAQCAAAVAVVGVSIVARLLTPHLPVAADGIAKRGVGLRTLKRASPAPWAHPVPETHALVGARATTGAGLTVVTCKGVAYPLRAIALLADASVGRDADRALCLAR